MKPNLCWKCRKIPANQPSEILAGSGNPVIVPCTMYYYYHFTAIFRTTCVSHHLVATQVTLVCAVVRSRSGSVMCWNYETDFLLSGRGRRNTWKTCTTSRCSWETWISWKRWATLSRFCYWSVFLPPLLAELCLSVSPSLTCHCPIFLFNLPFPSNRHHLSFNDFLEDKESYQSCSVLCCVRQLCTVICTHVWAVLKVECWFEVYV